MRLIQALADGLPIAYNSVVDRIQYSDSGVKVVAGGRMYQGASPGLRPACTLHPPPDPESLRCYSQPCAVPAKGALGRGDAARH